MMGSGTGINALWINENWKLVTEGMYSGRSHLPEDLGLARTRGFFAAAVKLPQLHIVVAFAHER